jgi:hypothetical protein
MYQEKKSMVGVFANTQSRRSYIGGSDARIIMGDDEEALLRLWREKRGEIEPKDPAGNLIVQLGVVTEDLNRRWYEANTGQTITDVQRQIRHPALRWMAATLDGRVAATEAVFEAKYAAAAAASQLIVLFGELNEGCINNYAATYKRFSERAIAPRLEILPLRATLHSGTISERLRACVICCRVFIAYA